MINWIPFIVLAGLLYVGLWFVVYQAVKRYTEWELPVRLSVMFMAMSVVNLCIALVFQMLTATLWLRR